VGLFFAPAFFRRILLASSRVAGMLSPEPRGCGEISLGPGGSSLPGFFHALNGMVFLKVFA
jgi:hypothetical protein